MVESIERLKNEEEKKIKVISDADKKNITQVFLDIILNPLALIFL
jgi:hypothetical protein